MWQVEDGDSDEFAGLKLKTARRIGGSSSAASRVTKPIPPPPAGAASAPLPPPPASSTSTAVKLVPLEDLLTGDSSADPLAPNVTHDSSSSSKDMDFFLNPMQTSIPENVSSELAASDAKGTTGKSASAMTESDFDAFLSSISSTK